MVWTNPLHHMHYQEVSMVYDGTFPMIKLKPGIWYRIFTVYFTFYLRVVAISF